MSFFQGTLQEGIATAVQQSKSVLCFVTDGETESKQWEDDFLTDANIASLLESEAVALRLEAGSQEEGFLTQLYPIPKKPTIVIIKDAVLKEYVASGVSKEDFTRRIQKALQSTPAPIPASPSPVSAATPAGNPSQPQPSPVGDSNSSTSSGRATPQSSNETQVQSVLAERAARLAVQKKKDEEEAKKRRVEKAAAKAESTVPEAQRKHVEAVRRKQSAAREERQRILQAIEDDKAARRARQAEKEAMRRAAEEPEEKQDDVPFAPASLLYPTSGRITEFCALQVRLLDGSTIRSKFSSHDTLKDVRQWVDDTTKGDIHGGGKKGYIFRILLTPLPSKTVDVTEEGKALRDLGLTPSATLILVPAPRRAATAYAAARTDENAFMGFISYILSFITGFFGVVLSFFSTLFSTAGPPQAPTQDSAPADGVASGRDRSQIGARRVSERRNDQQFYNGNSTNFEPRPDDDEE
ncbi:hypothetical protein B0T16DRAFT_425035 [Cercophora newfieldiana]|uniref:UBX domain-containing protein 2 n=1 Tax=Cercophora newfieldiana TaxID=92897 RepID=A0AA40CZQ3_9PEZI|nr:hypothetical protein B0T16DRAFT_425035 [Cercophora newfieldiana]